MTHYQDEELRPAARSGDISAGHLYVRMTAIFVLVLLAGMAGGIWIGRSTAGGAGDGSTLEAVDAVAELITENYYYRPTGPAEQEGFNNTLEQHAIAGMLASLDDDYTRYLEPADAQVAQDELEGQYGGIGVTLDVQGTVVTVARVGPDTPAARAGIRVGDVVQRIDNRPVASIETPLDGVDLRGPVGSTVVLTVLQQGAEGSIDVSIERELIIVHPVSYEIVQGTSYLLIRIDIFGDRTTQELDEALAFGAGQGATGIILDLRGNGGGWVRSAQETIGRFLPASVGPAMYEDTEPGRGGMVEQPIINGDEPPSELPLVVLVDAGTASAAEIVAGSLRDYDRALVVGEPTFGKGSVQRIFDFQDGASLRVTVAEWFTPSRGRIQDEGIRPDVLLTTGGSQTTGGDPFINAAVSFHNAGKTRPTDLASSQDPVEATPAT